MTNRIIVATFVDMNKAYDAASDLRGLKDAGKTDINVKAAVMIKKDHLGNVSVLEAKDRPLWGTAVGVTSGALIGLIGGAPGAALGAALGATAGLTGDTVMSALDDDFIDSVQSEMRPGMTAFIVEADEKSTRSVDEIVNRRGGHVHRSAA